MSSLFDLWKGLPPAWKRRVRGWWFEGISALDTGTDLLFLNHGCAPLDDAEPVLALDPDDEPHRFCIQLYHRVARPIDWTGRDGLEVSSGRGGGAAYVMRGFGPRSFVGIDLANNAVAHCNRHYAIPGLSFRQGDELGLRLSLGERGFSRHLRLRLILGGRCFSRHQRLRLGLVFGCRGRFRG